MKKYFLFIPLLILFSCKEKQENNNRVNFENELTKKQVIIATQNIEIMGLKNKLSNLEKELEKCDTMLTIIEN